MSNSTDPSSVSSGASARLTGASAGLSQAGLKAVAWVGVGVAAVLVGLRLYARLREARRFFTDDYWMIAALVVLTVNAILQTLQTESLYYILYVSVGRLPVDEELVRQGNTYVRYEFAIIGLMWTILWCVKASFLALFWRLFDGLPSYRRLWWMVVVFSFFAYVGCWIGMLCLLFAFFLCIPFELSTGILSISGSAPTLLPPPFCSSLLQILNDPPSFLVLILGQQVLGPVIRLRYTSNLVSSLYMFAVVVMC